MRRDRLVLLVLGAGLVYLVLRRHVVTAESGLFFLVLIPSIILHEVSHGALALVFGDDTAKRAGRLTLNPARHVDPFGTIILPALLVLTTGRAFGWAKPVPVTVGRLRHPRNEGLLVSLVGPAVNIVLALGAALALRWTMPPLELHAVPEPAWSLADRILFDLGLANVLLAAFNLIPLPPLDGSAVLERLLPRSWWPGYLRVRQYSMGVVLLVVLLIPQVLNRVFDPFLNLWARVLG